MITPEGKTASTLLGPPSKEISHSSQTTPIGGTVIFAPTLEETTLYGNAREKKEAREVPGKSRLQPQGNTLKGGKRDLRDKKSGAEGEKKMRAVPKKGHQGKRCT